jgi:hypothetical protein
MSLPIGGRFVRLLAATVLLAGLAAAAGLAARSPSLPALEPQSADPVGAAVDRAIAELAGGDVPIARILRGAVNARVRATVDGSPADRQAAARARAAAERVRPGALAIIVAARLAAAEKVEGQASSSVSATTRRAADARRAADDAHAKARQWHDVVGALPPEDRTIRPVAERRLAEAEARAGQLDGGARQAELAAQQAIRDHLRAVAERERAAADHVLESVADAAALAEAEVKAARAEEQAAWAQLAQAEGELVAASLELREADAELAAARDQDALNAAWDRFFATQRAYAGAVRDVLGAGGERRAAAERLRERAAKRLRDAGRVLDRARQPVAGPRFEVWPDPAGELRERIDRAHRRVVAAMRRIGQAPAAVERAEVRRMEAELRRADALGAEAREPADPRRAEELAERHRRQAAAADQGAADPAHVESTATAEIAAAVFERQGKVPPPGDTPQPEPAPAPQPEPTPSPTPGPDADGGGDDDHPPATSGQAAAADGPPEQGLASIDAALAAARDELASAMADEAAAERAVADATALADAAADAFADDVARAVERRERATRRREDAELALAALEERPAG